MFCPFNPAESFETNKGHGWTHITSHVFIGNVLRIGDDRTRKKIPLRIYCHDDSVSVEMSCFRCLIKANLYDDKIVIYIFCVCVLNSFLRANTCRHVD